MSLETRHFYEFQNFRLDPVERVLLRDGRPLSLTPKAFQLLRILVENHGHVVEKDRLISEIWADSFVEEGNLAVNAAMLRKVLNDDAANPVFIETVPRRGYRFIAEVKESSEDPELSTLSKGELKPLPRPRYSTYAWSGAIAIVVITAVGAAGLYLRESALSGSRSAPILSEPFSSTKFSTSGAVTNAVISPNGEYAAFTEEIGEKQSLWLRQIDSGENIQIIPPSDDYYFGLVFSHSGNLIYFVRRQKGAHGPPSLFRMAAFGGIPVKILDNALNWISLSPDDKQISFVRCNYKPDDYCALFVADSEGKNETRLVTRPNLKQIEANQFSPDGRSIAFASGAYSNGEPNYQIVMLDLATRIETPVTQEFFQIKSLHWLPSGNGLLFTAGNFEDGQISIWKCSLSNVHAEILTKDASSYPDISLDKSGRKAIATQLGNDFQIYVSSESKVSVLSSARDLTMSDEGRIVYSTFDGDIWVTNAEGTDKRQLTSGPWGDQHPRASPDGRYIFFRSNRSGNQHAWRINADGSNLVQITRNGGGGIPCAVSGDNKWLYYVSARMLRKVPVDGGDEDIISETKLLRPACSPDGHLVAYFFRDTAYRIGIMNTSDGSVVKTLNYGDGQTPPIHLAWSPDNRNLNFVINAKGQNELWQQSLDGTAPRQVRNLGNEEILQIAAMPDGNGYAFIRGKWINDAVLITGLR